MYENEDIILGKLKSAETSLGENAKQMSSFGAIGDGVANDYTAFNSLKTAYPTEKVTVILSKQYRIGNSINIPSNIELIGIKGAKIIPDSNISFNASNMKNIEIDTPLHGYQLNSTDSNIKIEDSTITADNYGILINGSANGKNIDIIKNNISANADPIEINTTSGDFSQIKILGNNINALGTGGGTSSGFAIGIAKGKDVLISNNIVEHSRYEAIHIEDAQERIIISNNILKSCYSHGVKFLNQTGAMPVIVTGNQIKKDDTNLLADSGVYVVYDANGQLQKNIISDNIINGFNYGVLLDGYSSAIVDKNTIMNCNIAIKNNSGILLGTQLCSDCTTLVQGGNKSRTGKIISLTEPTTILSYIGTSGYLGATLEGFNFPKASFSSANGGNNNITLFALPTRFTGVLCINVSNSLNFIKYMCEVTYDGSNLIIGKNYSHLSGIYSTPSLSISGGNLIFTFYSASSVSTSFRVDFEGDFYQA